MRVQRLQKARLSALLVSVVCGRCDSALEPCLGRKRKDRRARYPDLPRFRSCPVWTGPSPCLEAGEESRGWLPRAVTGRGSCFCDMGWSKASRLWVGIMAPNLLLLGSGGKRRCEYHEHESIRREHHHARRPAHADLRRCAG